ncbi:MAG: hypothetical protein NVS4B10_20680 [Myxococcales bacterium]
MFDDGKRTQVPQALRDRAIGVLLLLSVLASGCALGVEGRIPAGRARLSRQEAVAIATQTAVRRGFASLRVTGVERDDDEWQVELRVGPPARGGVLVRVDAWSGDIVRFSDDVRWTGRGRGSVARGQTPPHEL